MDLVQMTLDKSFEILGQWTPDYLNFQHSISGLLTYDTHGMTLEIYGTFESPVRTERVYGFSQDGKLIWIPNVMSRQENDSSPGYTIKKYSVQECFIFDVDLQAVGMNATEVFEQIFKDATTDFKVSELSFITNYMFSWFGKQMKIADAEDLLTIPYGILEKNTYSYNDLQLTTELSQKNRIGAQQLNVVSQAEIFLKDASEKSLFFSKLYRESLNVKKLIELFCEDDNLFDAISFKTNSVVLPFSGRYLFNQRGSRATSVFSDSALTLHDLEEDFNRILQNYYAKSEKLDLVVDTYLNEFYLNETNETKILNSIRNLEVYHRNFVEGNLPEHTDDALEIERAKINQFIEDNVHVDYRVRMQSQVNYSPEKNLRKRLQELIQRVPDKIFKQLGLKTEGKRKSRAISSFAYHVVETRNYYTHRDSPDRYPGRFETIEELVEANQTLRKICLYYIYHELGIKEDLILRALQ